MFGYKCEECGTGTVREEVRSNHQVKFDRIPFTVPEATVGVCDRCGAEHFSSEEYLRWRRLFDEAQKARQGVMSPSAIRELRERLGMTATDFAGMIGVARQTLHYWEDEERTKNQSRSAELMLRLVREALQHASVPVIEFLWEQASADDIDIKPPSCLPEARGSGHASRAVEVDPLVRDGAFDDLYSRPAGAALTTPYLANVA